MGKDWDDDKGGRKQWVAWMTEVMTECLRVLKPGAHGLVWALPRTSHWTATALEDAGFEVRDVVTHLFGTGFPKSMDISKAIDKAAGAEREIIGPNPHLRPNSDGKQCGYSGVQSRSEHVTAASTEAAKQWAGWGTALKPASEHWILVRKPCSEKTVAANVLKHGVGGINIDASRIATDELKGKVYNNQNVGWKCSSPPSTVYGNEQGRFPANLVLDEAASSVLDAQAAAGVSRFFYVAKASKSDKGADNTHPTVKSTALMTYLIKLVTPTGGVVLDPFMGSGSTGVAAIDLGFKFLGIESYEAYHSIANTRIQATLDSATGTTPELFS